MRFSDMISENLIAHCQVTAVFGSVSYCQSLFTILLVITEITSKLTFQCLYSNSSRAAAV